MKLRLACAGAVTWLLSVSAFEEERPRVMEASDLTSLPQPPPDHTIPYGPGTQQVAELRLPTRPGPHPVVILIHGGCWQTPWAMDHVRSLAAALTTEGVATWSLEYRRLGDPGGGWPGTFEDVARGADHLRAVGAKHGLDLERVVALGHSAGGQLALWLAARPRLPKGSVLAAAAPIPLRGAVSLAGVLDLRAAAADQVCGDAAARLLGDEPALRARQLSPIELVPLGVPQRLVCGAQDRLVPNQFSQRYTEAARRAGDDVRLELVEGAGHFELVDPKSVAWQTVLSAVRTLID